MLQGNGANKENTELVLDLSLTTVGFKLMPSRWEAQVKAIGPQHFLPTP